MNLTADSPLDELLERAAQIESCLIEEQNDKRLRSIIPQKADKRYLNRINAIMATTAKRLALSDIAMNPAEQNQCHFRSSEAPYSSRTINHYIPKSGNHPQFPHEKEKQTYFRKLKYWLETCRVRVFDTLTLPYDDF